MLQTITTVTHVFLAVAIIALVLLQRGKGAEAGWCSAENTAAVDTA